MSHLQPESLLCSFWPWDQGRSLNFQFSTSWVWLGFNSERAHVRACCKCFNYDARGPQHNVSTLQAAPCIFTPNTGLWHAYACRAGSWLSHHACTQEVLRLQSCRPLSREPLHYHLCARPGALSPWCLAQCTGHRRDARWEAGAHSPAQMSSPPSPELMHPWQRRLHSRGWPAPSLPPPAHCYWDDPLSGLILEINSKFWLSFIVWVSIVGFHGTQTSGLKTGMVDHLLYGQLKFISFKTNVSVSLQGIKNHFLSSSYDHNIWITSLS